MPTLPRLLSTLALATLAPLSAQAFVLVQPNLLVNGSFELGAWSNTSLGYMDVPTGSTVISGWTTLDNRVAWARTPTGELDPFDGMVRLSTRPGAIHHLEGEGALGRNILLKGGKATGIAKVTAVYGPSRIWVEDIGYKPAAPGVTPAALATSNSEAAA